VNGLRCSGERLSRLTSRILRDAASLAQSEACVQNFGKLALKVRLLQRVKGTLDVLLRQKSARASLAFLQLVLSASVLILAYTAQTTAQPKSISQFTHTSWFAIDGIPGPVRAILQTPNGYLWLGTEAGLYRFDGLRFVLLRESGLKTIAAGKSIQQRAARTFR
jgi:hypothetical protein